MLAIASPGGAQQDVSKPPSEPGPAVGASVAPLRPTGDASGTAAAATLSPPPAIYARVEVAPTTTSIYVGTVSMTMPTFSRVDGRYESTYAAKVFPYFFSNETGRLTVELSDDALGQLARGEVVAFTGHAVNTSGAERRVEGKATPADATSGKLKVRVFVSKRIELIFNTTYRFLDAK